MTLRPIPRWLHYWAILTVVVTFCLLLLGGLVTTFRVGMADPIWPTEPWYLFFINWQEPSRGFLIEHVHRLAGFTVGGLTAILAIGIWFTEPRSLSRWLGVAALIALLTAFGQFHGQMMKQKNAEVIVLPIDSVSAIFGSLGLLLILALSGLGQRHGRLRLLAVITLVAVMIQGLLGGFRVRLNVLAGTDLAAVHGIFGQVVFSLLVSLAVLTAKPREIPAIPDDNRLWLRRLAHVLVMLVFLQLVWGALTRHFATGLVQRLHILTAFLVVAALVWLFRSARESAIAWQRLRVGCVLLTCLIVSQVTLGVEAWLGKFATGTLPELQKVTTGQAVVRTAHMMIGSIILATSVSLMLLTRRPIKQFDAVPAMTPLPVPLPQLGEAT